MRRNRVAARDPHADPAPNHPAIAPALDVARDVAHRTDHVLDTVGHRKEARCRRAGSPGVNTVRSPRAIRADSRRGIAASTRMGRAEPLATTGFARHAHAASGGRTVVRLAGDPLSIAATFTANVTAVSAAGVGPGVGCGSTHCVWIRQVPDNPVRSDNQDGPTDDGRRQASARMTRRSRK
jgi:hypothetical protein